MSPLRFSYQKGERIIQQESTNEKSFPLRPHEASILFFTPRTTLFRISPPEVQPDKGARRVYTDEHLLRIAIENPRLAYINNDPHTQNTILQNKQRTASALLNIPYTEASEAILNSRK